MDWILVKYINLVSYTLKNFKQKRPNLWSFFCPYCNNGNNVKNPRAFIYEKNNKLGFFCHNCNKSSNIPDLIKDLNPTLYSEYRKETIQNKKRFEKIDETPLPPPKIPLKIFDSLKRMDELEIFHPAVSFLRKRKIPEVSWKLLYYAPKFKKFVNSVQPDKLNEEYEEPRLVIPYIDKSDSVIAFQCRSFDPNTELRYLTVTLDTSVPRVFGLNKVDFSKTVYAFEGPLDSLFIPNSIASGGSNILSVLESSKLKKSDTVVCFDKQPRNKEILGSIEKTIESGWKICLLPENFPGKDINEGIIAGLNQGEILDIINQNVYQNTKAKLAFSKWKKI